jgi:hypothetical protein
MSTLNPMSMRIRALSTAVSTALLAGLIAVGPVRAQSGAAGSDASEARKSETTKRQSASTESVGPFVYEALGATPSIRLPALFTGRVASGSAKEESRHAKVDSARRSDTARR